MFFEPLLVFLVNKQTTKIVTKKKSYPTLGTLSNFLESLSLRKFVRIHRSFAVLKGKVNEIGNKEVLISNKVLPIGKTYYKSASKELGLSLD
jgi:DNA-binding LytR/AlgR family response regulator